MRLLDEEELLLVTGGTENEGGQGNGEGEGGEEEGNPEGCTSESRTGEDGVEEVVIRCPRPSSGGT